jgi:hypothetical protein
MATPDGDGFLNDAAWRLTGDKRYLEALYGDEIQTDSQRMYMVTEGHWWSDRVELFSDNLQRERLGGIALRRNQFVAGHRVSWRFADPADAERVAILVTGAKPDALKAVLFNLSDHPVTATLTGWGVAPGQWRISQGLDADGDDKADGAPTVRSLDFEKGGDITVVLPPMQTTVLDLSLEKPGQPVWARPDLGFGAYDVVRKGRSVSVTVHSLGAVASPVTTVIVEDEAGRVLASTPLAALAAPLDLNPKTATVKLSLPGRASGKLRVRIVTPPGVREITQRNNTVSLP